MRKKLVVAVALTASVAGLVAAQNTPTQASPDRTRIDASFTEWAGTFDQRQASQVLRAYGENGTFSDCMAERGYDVPWEWAIALDPGVDALEVNKMFEPVDVVPAEFEAMYAENRRWLEGDEHLDGRTQAEVAVECLESTHPLMGEGEATALSQPPGLGNLYEAWVQEVEVATQGADTAEHATARVLEILPAFEDKHADEIARLAAHWADVEVKARAVGWAPDKPFGDLRDSLRSDAGLP